MKVLIRFIIVGLLLIGCGSSETSPSNLSENSIDSAEFRVAKDNMLRDVVKPFNHYSIKIVTDKRLGENEVSKDTIAVYGYIDDENTKALLKLNSNYPVGTKIVVKVFDAKSNELIGESETLIYSGGVVNFGTIEL
jgi:hypothetical protein